VQYRKVWLGGSQAATWTGLLLRRADGRCIGVCEGRKWRQMTCWKLQFPRLRRRIEVISGFKAISTFKPLTDITVISGDVEILTPGLIKAV
jgi:hypothetical protein